MLFWEAVIEYDALLGKPHPLYPSSLSTCVLVQAFNSLEITVCTFDSVAFLSWVTSCNTINCMIWLCPFMEHVHENSERQSHLGS